jgi:methionyl aminopeptidase
MTEKDYSGATTSKIGKNAKAGNIPQNIKEDILSKSKKIERGTKETENIQENIDLESYKKAGEIASKVKQFAKAIIKKDVLLAEIAEKIESKIQELGGEVAFPVNLSIDDVAAHYTPTLKDELKAQGLLKADIGVHVKGCICDIAFTLDLTPEKKHSKLIESSELALKSALELIKRNKDQTKLGEIGRAIQLEIEKQNFNPIVNLSGHGLDEFEIHSGLTIPNYDTKSETELGEGAFAIEPFSTLKTGTGSIYEGAGSNIYHILKVNQPRDNNAREILNFILENKKMLPFSKRELEKKFGTKALIAISNLKREGIIQEFPQLIEKNHQVVSQAETSIIIHQGKVEVLCD